MREDTAPMLLRLLTPEGQGAETGCDSVRLTIADDRQGRGGGSLGIRRGHAHAVMALGDGPLRADLGGKTVLSAYVRGGFATVEKDVITVITRDAEIRETAP